MHKQVKPYVRMGIICSANANLNPRSNPDPKSPFSLMTGRALWNHVWLEFVWIIVMKADYTNHDT